MQFLLTFWENLVRGGYPSSGGDIVEQQQRVDCRLSRNDGALILLISSLPPGGWEGSTYNWWQNQNKRQQTRKLSFTWLMQ